MKRCVCIILILAMFCIPVHAQEKKYVALTFDDGPSGRFTSRLLDGLAEREVSATFFLCGYRVEQFPKLAARIADEGHEIGTHGYAHKFFSDLSTEGVCSDLKSAQQCILEACGHAPTLLRPPGGKYCTKALRSSVCAELPVILWSVDPRDWQRTDRKAIAADVVKKTKNGDIILMHDMSDSSVDAALDIIDELGEQGFEFLTVSELAARTGTELCPCETYHSFPRCSKNEESSDGSAATEP